MCWSFYRTMIRSRRRPIIFPQSEHARLAGTLAPCVATARNCHSRRGAPARFACGLGAVWLVVTAWVFHTGHPIAGYVLGGLLTGVAGLVSTTDICMPSLVYRSVFGFPRRRDTN